MKRVVCGGRRIMNRRNLCLYLLDWPIQGLAGHNSAFRIPHSALAVILHSRDPRRGDLVVACNAAAGECGVRLGMPLAEAAVLTERGGECLTLPHDRATDLADLARLAERCE